MAGDLLLSYVHGLDENGQPVSVPQEAADEAFKSGKLRFNPGDRVPVVLNGVEGTLPADEAFQAVQAGDAQTNFDPHGTAKAATAGILRSLSLGGSDWLAIEGERFLHGDKGAESMRQSLEGLKQAHPTASMTGEVAGAIIPMLIPGGAEAEAATLSTEGARAAQAAAKTEGLLTTTKAAQQAGAALKTAGAGIKAAAAADAAKGTLSSSVLARTLRAANPYNAVGAAGQLTRNALTSALGGGRLAELAGRVGQFATEGAVISAANAADEAELGEVPLTGETLFSSLEHGVLWGSALGLVGTGAGKIFTSAARLASRLSDKMAQAQLGASPAEQRVMLQRFGPGSIGRMMLKNGWNPLWSPEQQYEWAQSLKEIKGEAVGRAVEDAVAGFRGVSGEEILRAIQDATEEPVQNYSFLGNVAPAARNRIIEKVKQDIGWLSEPEPPPVVTPAQVEDRIQATIRQARIQEPEPPTAVEEDRLWRKYVSEIPKPGPEPKLPTKSSVERLQQELAIQRGLDKPITKEDILSRANQYRDLLVKSESPEEKEKLLKLIQDTPKILADERQSAIESLADDARRISLENYEKAQQAYQQAQQAYSQAVEEARVKAKDALRVSYGEQKRRYDNIVASIRTRINQEIGQREFEYLHALRAVREHNSKIRVGFKELRQIRQTIDKTIPWKYANATDAPIRAAEEVKLAARSAIEDRVEQGFDEAARNLKDPAVLGRYLHSKHGYAMAKEIVRGAERARARDASLFGRASRVGIGGMMGHVTLGAAAALTGHPVAGAYLAGRGAAEHYGPKFLAWALHKASALAKLKAVQQDVLIGVRRGVRSALEKGEPKRFARVAIKDMTPQEARMTAAEAMAHIAKLAGNTSELRSRLASLDPNLPIVAPKTFNAAEGTFRRAVLYLANQIPDRLMYQYRLDGRINPKDMTDAEAREFLENIAVAVDPRVATDALGSGTITAAQAKALKVIYPAILNNARATLSHISSMDREAMDYIHPHKRDAATELFGTPDPSFTLSLQANAQMLTSASQAVGGKGATPKGMTHAAATSKGMAAMINLERSQSQLAESGPPGRRGKRASE